MFIPGGRWDCQPSHVHINLHKSIDPVFCILIKFVTQLMRTEGMLGYDQTYMEDVGGGGGGGLN